MMQDQDLYNSELNNPWKRKYYNRLEEIARKEKAWSETESLLRKAITRLTLAADNSHTALNHQMKLLRNAIRDGENSLQLRKLIDDISDNILELDNLRKHGKSEAALGLLHLAKQFNFPDSLKRKTHKLKSRLTEVKKTEDINPVVTEFVQLLEQTIAHQQKHISKGDETHSSFIGGIFGRRQSSDVTATMQESADQALGAANLLKSLLAKMPAQVTEQLAVNELSDSLALAKNSEDLLPVVDRLAEAIDSALTEQEIAADSESESELFVELLEKLLDCLELPDHLMDQVPAIKSVLKNESGWDSNFLLLTGLKATAGLVNELSLYLQAEQRELQAFLRQLTARLSELDSDLQVLLRSRLEANEGCRKLDEGVNEEAEQLTAAIMNAPNFEYLQQTVKTCLSHIRDQMGEYRKEEEERNDFSIRMVKQLSKQLYAMEQEAEVLRSQMRQKHEQSLQDILTGVPNRMAYEERIASEFARFNRYRTAFTLMVLDVDNFKRINDSYGHAAGDKVIKVIAEMIRDNIRSTDFVGRYGGDEFIIIMPETGSEHAQTAAEKLRGVIAESDFHYRDKKVSITISAGLSECLAGDDQESLFGRADEALYQAKTEGRDCLRIK